MYNEMALKYHGEFANLNIIEPSEDIMMDERPIVFTPESVRTILAGQKTQTRRVIKCNPNDLDIRGKMIIHREGINWFDWIPTTHSPYGQPGDHLWVREGLIACHDSEASIPVALYEAGKDQVILNGKPAEWEWKRNGLSPIYMPRWASRITLEIVNVRVERLNQINGRDCLAEGITKRENGEDWLCTDFSKLWDSINARRGYSWQDNPWVWVIEFKKLETPAGDEPDSHHVTRVILLRDERHWKGNR